MTPEQIARVAHEVNRAYCEALGDTSQAPWEEAPQWQRDSALLGVQLHLTNPNAGPQASHESWMAQKLADGWVYGDRKDADLKQHHCLVPFDQLPREQQAKDYLFRGVVHALAGAARLSPQPPMPVVLVEDLKKIFAEKLTATGSMDDAFKKAVWVAYYHGNPPPHAGAKG